ncbi:MAG: hypothetical protein ACYDAN_02410 [Candidatus Limnocylindrales bacterium]
MKPIDVRAITVGGEIGRNIDLTTDANFLAPDRVSAARVPMIGGADG